MLRILLVGWLILTAIAVVAVAMRWLFRARSERVIERQTVVVRCSHCGTMTPVDARTCDNCGASMR